ncbi:hypothetical protein D9M69_715060 [compost metagenome]
MSLICASATARSVVGNIFTMRSAACSGLAMANSKPRYDARRNFFTTSGRFLIRSSLAAKPLP